MLCRRWKTNLKITDDPRQSWVLDFIQSHFLLTWRATRIHNGGAWVACMGPPFLLSPTTSSGGGEGNAHTDSRTHTTLYTRGSQQKRRDVPAGRQANGCSYAREPRRDLHSSREGGGSRSAPSLE